ncbi:MAG: ribonuclease P protein component [Gemmatimonadaceae bacterium]
MVPKKHGYSRRLRLREGDLAAIRGAGKRLRTEHLSAQAASSLLPYCRVAVVIGKHGRSVVKRNKLRRRLRELVRVHVIPAFAGVDVVLYANPSAYDLEFDELTGETIRIKTQLASVVQ